MRRVVRKSKSECFYVSVNGGGVCLKVEGKNVIVSDGISIVGVYYYSAMLLSVCGRS